MLLLVVIAGPIASGKTTVAEGLGGRLRAADRQVAVLDLDDLVATIGGYEGLPPDRFRQAQQVFAELVGSWLEEGFDVVAHGPFLQSHEIDRLLHAVPAGIRPRRVVLHATHEVARARVEADPRRAGVIDHELLETTYDRFDELRPSLPPSEWAFDTTVTDAEAIVDELATALLARGGDRIRRLPAGSDHRFGRRSPDRRA